MAVKAMRTYEVGDCQRHNGAESYRCIRDFIADATGIQGHHGDGTTDEEACDASDDSFFAGNLFCPLLALLLVELAEGIVCDSFAGVAAEVEGDLAGHIDVVFLVDSDDILFHHFILP